MKQSLEMFFRLGFRNVSMDDIASKLGFSKKTLYQYFSTKNELIEQIMLQHIEEEKRICDDVEEKVENAIDQILEIYKYHLDSMSGMNPSSIFELKKYYPSAWKHFETHKNSGVCLSVLHNIELGIKQGLYREDVNPEIISRLYTSRMDIVMDGETFPQPRFPFWDVMKELFIYHIRGIATEKGIKHLQNTQLNF